MNIEDGQATATISQDKNGFCGVIMDFKGGFACLVTIVAEESLEEYADFAKLLTEMTLHDFVVEYRRRNPATK